ncbi:MAG: glycosyltransferase family 2 protein [Planctomycetes bacterium]|nr:glycosyltransferase family 2 protein [Planctomycetota bacterium]
MSELVSVVIPTFNRAHLLPECVRSVLAQAWRPLEVVLVNDGSSDNTAEVMTQLAAEAAAAGIELNAISQPNSGAAGARNTGMKAARGQWFCFLDDDDRWYPHKLATQMPLLEKTGADACSAVCLIIEPDGFNLLPERGMKLLDGFNPADYLLQKRYATINSLVVRRDVIERTGEFEPGLRMAEDLEWLARLTHEATFCAAPEVLLSYDRTRPQDALTYEGDLEAVWRNHENRERMLMLARERCSSRRGWDEQAWRQRAGIEYRMYVRHRLRAKQWRKAIELYHKGMEVSHGADPIARMGGKILKAKLKALFT